MNMMVVAQRLQEGQDVTFRPRGHSMTGRVNDGDLVTVRPMTDKDILKKGMVVVAKVKGHVYLHLVKAVRKGSVQIGNNKGHINGWTSHDGVYGILVSNES